MTYVPYDLSTTFRSGEKNAPIKSKLTSYDIFPWLIATFTIFISSSIINSTEYAKRFKTGGI